VIAQKDYTILSFIVFALSFVAMVTAGIYYNSYYLFFAPFLLLIFYGGWQATGFVFQLMLFSLPLSIEYMVTETLGTDLPDEVFMVACSFIFACYWIYHPRAISKETKVHPVIILLAVGFGWTLFCTANSTHPILSLKYALAKTWYFGAFVLAGLIVFRNRQAIVRSGVVLLSSMLIVVLVILVRHSLYGFGFRGINPSVFPFFRNHVNYSSMLVCLIPVALVFWRSESRGARKNWLFVILIVLLGALFFTYARGAWLALATGLLAIWLIRRKVLVATYICVILVVGTAIFFLRSNDRYLEYAHDYRTTIWHENFREHLVATYQMKDASTAERFYRWIAGIRMIPDRWFAGYGPNTFYHNYKPYAIPAFKTWVSDNPERSTVHNYFLLLAIEQGIPGLLFFLLLTLAMLFYTQRLYHAASSRFYQQVAVVAASVTVMILTTNFLSDLVETDKVGSLFYLCISLLVAADIANRTGKKKAGGKELSS
jgi:O-antigen ligase